MGLELLAPARNAEQGILALRCGADAVYMGGARFGARQAAGCSAADFEQLTREARLWDAKVYATINTILFDHELEDARKLAWELYEAGVDALIIQDMGLLELDLPPLPLHASTQAVCDSPEKVAFLANVGFSRAILAREQSLDEIRAIHNAAEIELEGFVFGALCVGESGRCYLSGAVCGRSGNRGECAQPCRAPWNLVDAKGRVLITGKHLLSIQDLDLSDHLEEMADAGITGFKIEGRLKDADYVKNVVGHLRRRLDVLLERRPELGRASIGRVQHAFTPDPTKTFQRGLSTYRLDGIRRPMGTPEAAGHLGEFIGVVRSIQGDRVVLDREVTLHAGDGLAFIENDEVTGTVVNAAEGRQAFVQDPSRIKTGMKLHRNVDHQWLKALRAAKVERRIPVRVALDFPEGAVRLRVEDEQGFVAEARHEGEFSLAKDLDGMWRSAQEALSRLGDTPFTLGEFRMQEPRFVPVSRLNALRREAAEGLEAQRQAPRSRPGRRGLWQASRLPLPELDFTWNVANPMAISFYEHLAGKVIEPAAELQSTLKDRVVMTTRHCIRYELGWCPVHANPDPWKHLPEPGGTLFLENGSTRLECRFDCRRCRMELVLR
jgi:23S rRNA 5-hydroxycytidine C2501 synthase